jgi:hypothetical protein
VAFTSCNDDDELVIPEAYSNLPQKAQMFVSQHFGPQNLVSVTEIEDTATAGVAGYDVELTDNRQVEFNKDGVWQYVEGNGKALPNSILLQFIPSIPMYMEKNFPDKGITRYDRAFYGIRAAVLGGPSLSFTLAGDLLGYARPRESMPLPAQQLLDDYFDPAGMQVEFFEVGEGDSLVYTAQFDNGYQARFDIAGDWLSLKGDSATHFLPKGVTGFLPQPALDLLDQFLQGELTSISRPTAASNISIIQAYKDVNNAGDSLLFTVNATFTTTGEWISLEDLASGLPDDVVGLLPQATQDLLTEKMPVRLKDFTSIRQDKVRFPREWIDLISIRYVDAAVFQFSKSDGAWYSFSGALPANITDLLPEKTATFLNTNFKARLADANQKIRRMQKAARWNIPMNTTDTTDVILSYIEFNDNSNMYFDDSKDGEWDNIVLNNTTSTQWKEIAAATLPMNAYMYLDATFGIDSSMNYITRGIYQERIAVDTIPTPDVMAEFVGSAYTGYNVEYAPNPFGLRNLMRFDEEGNPRYMRAASGLNALPASVVAILSDELKKYIAAIGLDVNNLTSVSQMTMPQRLYSVDFLSADTIRNVKIDLTRDPALPEIEDWIDVEETLDLIR